MQGSAPCNTEQIGKEEIDGKANEQVISRRTCRDVKGQVKKTSLEELKLLSMAELQVDVGNQ